MEQVITGLRGEATLRENFAFSEVLARVEMADGREIQWLERKE